MRKQTDDKEAANECFSQLLLGQIETIEAIAMDMSAAYVKFAKSNIPLAEEKIIHDRFHVMKLTNEAVDKIRKEENKRLNAEGDETPSRRIPKQAKLQDWHLFPLWWARPTRPMKIRDGPLFRYLIPPKLSAIRPTRRRRRACA